MNRPKTLCLHVYEPILILRADVLPVSFQKILETMWPPQRPCSTTAPCWSFS